MNKRILQPLTVEIRSTGEGKTIIEGYVCKFNQRSRQMRDWWGDLFVERVAKGAFARSLTENEDIKCFWNHNADMVLGSTRAGTLQLVEDDIGLRYSVEPPNTTWGNDAVESVRRGDVSGTSFGFNVRKDDWEYLAEEDLYQRTLMDIDLIEVSPTPLPAYPDSEAQVSERSFSSESKEKLQVIKKQVKGDNETDLRKLELEIELMSMGINLRSMGMGDGGESCICSNCNHGDNCQSTGAKCCICGNCPMVSQCCKPGASGCQCSTCTLCQNNCCQPGSQNCLCSNCPNKTNCKKGDM